MAKDIQLAELIDMNDSKQVWLEVSTVLLKSAPTINIKLLAAVFQDIERMFAGEYTGYRACNTPYHDLKHTTDATLAMARLLHADIINGNRYSDTEIKVGILSALFHDVGYLQTSDDTQGTGAKYTLTHVQRSMHFAQEYAQYKHFPDQEIAWMCKMIHCTDPNFEIEKESFPNSKIKRLGQMLATADYMGQMADRTYLEKLLFLFYEFKEANIDDYANEHELLEKTLDFAEYVNNLYADKLDNINQLVIYHFKEHWKINQDLYAKAINNHLNYLRNVIDNTPYGEHRQFFKRDNLINQLEPLPGLSTDNKKYHHIGKQKYTQKGDRFVIGTC